MGARRLPCVRVPSARTRPERGGTRMRRRSLLVVAVASALVVGLLAAVPAVAAPPAACANRPNNTIAKLLECVTLDGVREHQAAFQEIADDNGGNRFSGSRATTRRSTTSKSGF